MRPFVVRGMALQVVVVFVSASFVRAECPTIDFEDLAVNTAVTTQYDGVTFSVQPQTCDNNPTLYMRIATPVNGTSSGTKCIRIAGGCPDFSDDYLRMVFDAAQEQVSFTLGDWAATYAVRYYSTTSGAGLIGSFNVAIPPAGGGDVGVHRRVTVTSASTNIRRIEVQGATSSFEAIDDLTLSDRTPPVSDFSSPAPLACICNGSSIFGSAYDPDGTIRNWQLHRKALGALSWTLIRNSVSEVIDGELGPWTTSAADGWYTLRLTVNNSCELQTVSTNDVYLDRVFNILRLDSPPHGAIVGGGVCADGTAWEQRCGGTFNVERRPAGGAIWTAFDVVHPPWVMNNPLGSWNTRIGSSDGNYDVRLTGIDDCNNTASAQATVTVDNTAPVAVIASPITCDYLDGEVQVRGTVSDAHLSGWALYYTGGDAHDWMTIATGHGAVNNNILGIWNTAGLRPCAYTLRLVATDSAILDCNGALHNQTDYEVSVNVGGHATRFDVDDDGDIDLSDFLEFQGCFGGPGVPPSCGR